MRSLLAVLLLAAACGGKAKPAAPAPAPVENKPAEPAEVAPAPAPAPAPDSDAAWFDDLERRLATEGVSRVPACDDYLRAFVKLARCEQAGPALDGLRQGLAATVRGWEAWKELDAEAFAAAQEAATPGCQAGIDAIRQTADALGCPP